MSFYNKIKLGLAAKIMLAASIAMTAFFILSGILIYTQRANSIYNEAVKNHGQMARLLASSVSDAIDRQLEPAGKTAVISEEPAIEIIFDEASKKWCLTLPDKSLVDIEKFFKELKDFTLGETGDAVVVDDKSYLVFHPNAQPFTNKFCDYDELRKLLDSKSRAGLIDTAYLHGKGTFSVIADIGYPPLSKKGINWFVVVSQDKEELLSPLNDVILQIAELAVFLVLLTMFAAFMMGRFFLRPIQALKEGMQRLAAGDLDYVLQAKSRDEIGQLAEEFNKTAEIVKKDLLELKREGSELEKVKEEIAGFSRIKTNMLFLLSGVRAVLSNIKTGGEAERLLRHTDALLDIVGIESGTIPLKTEVIDIKELIKKAVFVFEPKVKEKDLDFKLNIPRGKIFINADLNRLAEVFNNLMQNAIRFTQKGHIEVSIKELNDKVEFSVADTGTGISRDKMPYIFDGLQPDKNSGLGLYFAKTVIKGHNGEIWVQSEIGKGSKFTFILNKVPPPA
ncbi:MAG: ATP-binding protein [Candidatus Omnitrophica bacterium]|nr:ATP-binding protein [Candidatus Omnitrophota bacterium]